MNNKADLALDENQKRIFAALKRPDGVFCCIQAHLGENSGFVLEFLSKGAANVVFRCRPCKDGPRPTSTPLQVIQITDNGNRARCLGHDAIQDMVIRVPRGMPKCLSGVEIMDGFTNHITPLFTSGLEKHLMEHQLIALFPDVVESLIKSGENGLIPVSNHAISQSRWAIRLPDMSSIPGSSITVEVKPKWLTQSPDAPRDAIRCRTCAMQLVHPKSRESYICPLRLVDGDYNDLYPWVHGVVQSSCKQRSAGFAPTSGSNEKRIADVSTKYLVSGDGRKLLQHLRRLQGSLDPKGVLHRPPRPDSFDHNLRLAMTLRDCSLFLNVSYNKTNEPNSINIISKLADLDFKSAEKIPDWAEKEGILHKEGMYTKKSKDDVDCWLARKR